MTYDDKYTIDPYEEDLGVLFGLHAGPWYDCLQDCLIIGPYCCWPKQEPMRFVVNMGPSTIIINEEKYKAYPGMSLKKSDPLIDKKFYQKLNRKKW